MQNLNSLAILRNEKVTVTPVTQEEMAFVQKNISMVNLKKENHAYPHSMNPEVTAAC